MERLTGHFELDVRTLDALLGVERCFDMIARDLVAGGRRCRLYVVDGYGDDAVLERMIGFWLALPSTADAADAQTFIDRYVTFSEVNAEADLRQTATAVFLGKTLLLAEGYGECILIDAKSYPSRGVEEPSSGKVLRGAHDGFIETLVQNAALLRRRIRTPQLTLEGHKISEKSRADVVLCYLEDKVDRALLARVRAKLAAIDADSISMSQESIAESMMDRRQWFNPFPRVRYTERPDAATASIMEGSIVFYTYGSTLELYGQQFTAGMLSADLLNLSPDEYRPMSKRMKQVTSLAEEYEQSGSIELWWKLNEELAALCGVLRRYQVFRLLLDEDEDAFFSVIREVTGQFDLFPKKEHEPSEEIQRKRLERVANEISARSETVKDAPLDLFHPSEAALEKGDAFYYEMLRAIGPTKDAWRDYKKYIRRYETYLHDIRAFNGTIRNFISFSLSKLKHNSPEDYAAALYGFYNDERIAEKLIVNPIRNNGDCYTTHDAYELSYVPRPLPDGSVAICQEHVTDSLQALMKADYMLALNSGHNVRRCIICGRYFLLKSGVHALYCEGACPHAPGYTCRQFGSVEVQKELAKDIPKVKVKVTAFSRITKDLSRNAISQKDARKAKDYVRDLLYDALRDANISVEAFEQRISSERVYQHCGITRTANPRGRPPKEKAGEQA